MFNVADSLKTQMTSLLVTDDILQNLKDIKNEKLAKINTDLDKTNVFVEKIDQARQEKDDMGSKLQQLTKENENLKLKFSQLLDQFQEYVNESERKIEEDQLV